MILGSTPTTPELTILAMGFRLYFFTASSETKKTAAAPSFKPEAFPALNVGQIIVRVDSRYFRPAEVETLLGDASKAELELGWKAKISVKELCAEMVQFDLKIAQKNALLKQHGYTVDVPLEK